MPELTVAGWIVQGGATTLVVIVVLMILTGRLVPRRTLDDALKDRDHWRSTAEQQAAERHILLEGARTTVDLLQALPPALDQSNSSSSRPDQGDRV